MADPTPPAPACDVDGTCYCPLTGLVETLGRKYSMQLVSVVGAHGPIRFVEVAEHLSTASSSTVSKRLDEFESAGLVTRTQYDEIPPRVEYALTEDGADVRDRLDPLLEWVTDRAA